MNIIQQVLKMQWSDYLDILVVAFLIYKLLPLLRTPHIMRLARTVIALVLQLTVLRPTTDNLE